MSDETRIRDLRREVLQTHRRKYDVRFRRRWGAEPPAHRVKHVAFLHEGGDAAAETLRTLALRGLSVEEWNPSLPGWPPPPDRAYHGLILATAALPDDWSRKRFRELVSRGLHDSTWIAAAGPAVALLAEDGYLRGLHAAFPRADAATLASGGALPADTSPFRDGSFLTASGPRALAEVTAALLDLIPVTTGEGATNP